MAIRYRSDFDPDFRCLESYLKDGKFGRLHDLNAHQSQHDLEILKHLLQNVADSTPWVSKEMREEVTRAVISEIELPTRYDAPSNFKIIDSLVTQVKAAATKIGIVYWN